ncbi:MAG: phosphoribosylglycinamide synthetase C domain-containing protein, partial [Candidatus Omnitrophota bacterium]
MGSYSPAPIVTPQVLDTIITQVIEPTVRGMYQEGIPFKGVLYAGLMLTQEGPFVLEFNTRFGDPETQSILPRLKSDLVEIMMAACDGRLNELKVQWDPRPCVCVVITSGGYPGRYKNGFEITGLSEVSDEDAIVFHAGTKNDGGTIVTAGGRVLGVTSLGNNLETSIRKAYEAVDKVHFDHMFFRRDIGQKALNSKVGA